MLVARLSFTAELPYHSVARQCIGYCKGDTGSWWEMAILACQNSVLPEAID